MPADKQLAPARARRLYGVLLGCAAAALGGCALTAGTDRDFAANVTGLQAKILCSEVFVAGRDPGQVMAQELSSANLHPEVHTVAAGMEAGGQQAAFAEKGDIRRRAVFRGNLGCALQPDSEAATRTGSSLAFSGRDNGAFLHEDTASINPAALARLRNTVAAAFADPDPDKPQRTRAILVVRENTILAEQYAPGFDQATPIASYSMGKALTNALIGILIERGQLTLDTPLKLPQWRGENDGRARITVRHLLHMTSGLDAEKQGRRDMGSRAMSALFGSIDAEAYALNSPLREPPGTAWWYSNANTFVLLHLVRQLAGGDMHSVRNFIHSELFEPLAMQHSIIEFNAFGTPMTTSFNYLSARDWARFGLLYLNDGNWQNRRLLPKGWVSFTGTPAPVADHLGFGAHWHVNAGIETLSAADLADKRADLPPYPNAPADAIFALGDSGQSLAVIPSRRLVVVRLGQVRPPDTSWDYNRFIGDVVSAVDALAAPQ